MTKIIFNRMISTHLISLVFYTIIYYHFFGDVEKNFIIENTFNNKDILTNSLFYSTMLQTTAGYSNLHPKSKLIKLIMISQLLISYGITFGSIYLSLK
jgi:hypothetical protein